MNRSRSAGVLGAFDSHDPEAGPRQKDDLARLRVVGASNVLDVDFPAQVSRANHGRNPAATRQGPARSPRARGNRMGPARNQAPSRNVAASHAQRSAARAHPPRIAGTIKISAADSSNCRIGVDRPGPSSRNARRPAVKCSANADCAATTVSGQFLSHSARCEVAVSGFEQPQFRHNHSAPFSLNPIVAPDQDWPAVFAFLAAPVGLGRRLPYVPRKILPRFDRLSPLPICLSPPKNVATI